ncbi:MAG: zf-HC2 domain-containing protein [Nocardioides sp.]|nr:zf-HC2 domain-containing protein [Nocardioides sp.]
MGPAIGHVGNKVSALIDGQLPATESERLWAHVHSCGACRDLVEREGWVKTRLAGLALCGSQPSAPNYLRSVLCEPIEAESGFKSGRAVDGSGAPAHDRRRAVMAAALGAGSIGAALCGVLVLSVPADAPVVDRRGPVTSLTTPSVSPRTVLSPTRGPVRTPANAHADADSANSLLVGGGLSGEMARLSVPLAR